MKARRSTFFFVRVSVLLAVLAIVLLYAWHDVARRRARNKWEEPLTIGLVVVRQGPVDAAAVAKLAGRVRALEDRLASEFRRRGGGFAPIRFVTYGPVDAATPPPPAPVEDGVVELVRHTFARWRWTRAIDAEADVRARGLDGRLYVVARPAEGDTQTVEGLSEQGGRVGIALVELDEEMVDFALFVATHELFHTLGASDQYGPDGRAKDPGGFAEPDRRPRWPQRWAEVMARARPVAPGVEETPESLDELAVGDATAREIGWIR